MRSINTIFQQLSVNLEKIKEPIRSFNPELNVIMMTINQCYYREHPESTITIEHLIQRNIAKEDKYYYFLRGDINNKEDVRKYKEIWEITSRIVKDVRIQILIKR